MVKYDKRIIATMKKVVNQELELPQDIECIRPVIEQYLEYKKERGERYKGKIGLSKLINRLADMGAERAADALEYSMSNNWAGVFEPKTQQATRAINKREEEFAKVLSLISRYGRNNFVTAVQYIDSEETKAAIRQIGWNKLCNMQTDTARKLFMEAYGKN